MEVFSALCHCIASAGHRRGAQMGVLRIDHPDIEAFINAKTNIDRLTGFNLSFGLTDAFMEAKAANKPFDLTFKGETYKTVDPNALWEMAMRSNWDWGEPGALFLDTINRNNNLWYCELIAATNPCGEQPLPPGGACLLGSFNVVRYLTFDAATKTWSFNWDQLKADIPAVVRAMDNVVDRAVYPHEFQRLESLNKRRMGLGIMGFANASEALGFPYGSRGCLEFEAKLLDLIAHEAYYASAMLAKEKGSFPLYDEKLYMQGTFIRTLPDYVQDAIRKHGIRNSHLTSIAPTGTISFSADYVSSGIEPVFGFESESADGHDILSYGGMRDVITPEGKQSFEVSDYGFRELGVRGQFAQRLTTKEHVDVLLTAATRVDSAVSKTINVDGTMKWDDFKGIYDRVWEGGGKGCTTFNRDGLRMGIFKKAAAPTPAKSVAEDMGTCIINPDGSRDCG
jgi:ribonucleoside-diphosphate reductase alpha chain